MDMHHLPTKVQLLRNRSLASGDAGEAWIWTVSDWMNYNYEVPFFVTIVYVLFVYFGSRFMAKREAYELQIPLVIWNGLLAVFSIYGFVMTFPIFIREWVLPGGRGLSWELCHAEVEISNPWTMYFCLSKIPELLDTVFIVLRKRPLKFLQYYHHIVTMWFCWIAWARKLDSGGAYAVMNLFVHSFMYSYYCSSALHIRWPQWARKAITFSQLSQMVMGLVFVLMPYVLCPEDYYLLFGGFVMYFTYFVLFAQLYYDMYLRKPEGGEKRGAGEQPANKKPKTD